jgi:flagellar hook-associated protein 2
MPSTTVSGLASGIQWQDTIDQLMEIERQPVNLLEQRKAEYQAKTSAWNQLESKLNSLQSTSEGMDTLDELVSKSASTSDADFLSVSAEAGAVSGTHTVEINQLAQNEIRVHDTGWPDLNTTSITQTGNTFQYTFDGTTRTLTLPNGATLLDLVQAINNDEDNPGIIASTLDDGSGSDSFHLVLTAEESKSANSLVIDDGVGETDIGSVTNSFDNTDFVNTQDAQSAEFRVNGYPTAGWITRDSNVIDDVIEGVTFTLKKSDAGATSVTIGVADNYTTVKSKINDWVNAYNDVIQFIRDVTSYDSENEVMGILMNDSQVRTVRDQLIDIVANEIPGIDGTATKYTSFAMAGLDISDGSKIKVDDSDLQDALEDDIEAVANMFVFTSSSSDSSISFFTKTEETEGGEYAVSLTYLANGHIDSSASNTIGGYSATVVDDIYLLGENGSPVEGLRLRFDSPGGSGTINSTVRIGTGAAVMADNKVTVMTDSYDGLFTTVKDGYDDQIEHIDDQIEAYEQRLEIRRQTLEAQYLAMEQAVSEANATSSYLSAI